MNLDTQSSLKEILSQRHVEKTLYALDTLNFDDIRNILKTIVIVCQWQQDELQRLEDLIYKLKDDIDEIDF